MTTIGHGPAGVAYYPGTGLPEAWRDHFFVCDFPGGVRAFTLQPSGASYKQGGLFAQTNHTFVPDRFVVTGNASGEERLARMDRSRHRWWPDRL